MSVLTAAAGLLRVLVFLVNRFCKCLAVCNLRSADICFYVELTQQSVNDNLQMQFTHAGNNCLACLGICVCLECRIFFRQLLERVRQLVLSCLRLGLDRKFDNGIREFHRLQNNRCAVVAECITGTGYLQANRSGDITGEYFVDFLSLICVHLQETPDSFLLILRGIQNIRAGLASTGIYSHECKLSNERIGNDLERKSGKRLTVRRMSLNFVAVKICAFDRRYVQRRRHILDNSIEALLYAFVLVSGAAAYRYCSSLTGSLPQSCFELGNGYSFLAAFQELLGQIIIELADLFDHLLVIHLCFILKIVRNSRDFNVRSIIVLIVISVHLEQINQADIGIFLANRNVDHNRVLAQSVLDLVNAAVIVCADDIHLVDECHTGYVVLISLAPYIFGLGFNAALCGEYAYSAVQYTQRSLYLNGKVYVAGSINNIDTVLKSTSFLLMVILQCPVACCSRGRDGDTTLLLLLHVVHGSSAVVRLANLIVNTGIIQDTLCQSRLACIDMRHDTDVPGSFQGIFSMICLCHRFSS